MSTIEMRRLRTGEAGEALALYESCKGLPLCLWNEVYPDKACAEGDIKIGALYGCFEDGRLLAVATAGAEREYDECGWTQANNPCELTRVGVLPCRRGEGLATRLLEWLLPRLSENGYDAARLLAGIDHAPAIRLYERLGFAKIGECEAWGNRYFMMEKRLDAVKQNVL